MCLHVSIMILCARSNFGTIPKIGTSPERREPMLYKMSYDGWRHFVQVLWSSDVKCAEVSRKRNCGRFAITWVSLVCFSLPDIYVVFDTVPPWDGSNAQLSNIFVISHVQSPIYQRKESWDSISTSCWYSLLYLHITPRCNLSGATFYRADNLTL